MMEKFINVSNRLPVTITDTIQKSSGGLVSALEAVRNNREFVWVGWPGEIADPGRQKEFDKKLRSDYQYFPVFVPQAQVDGFYHGFSNSTLWPILHSLPYYMSYKKTWWQDYVAVNAAFADKVLEIAGDRDIVWVHDYHLMLLPAMLRAKRPKLRIGFFLHTPFPPEELFRCLPHREELLEGLVGADLIGFHTFTYLRDFQATLLRLLGIESTMTSFSHNDRNVSMGVYPIGINAESFQQKLDSPEFHQRREELSKLYEGKQIILGVERLDYTKGLPRRLRAMETFLRGCPDPNKVMFILICVPSRGAVPAYKELRQTVESRVGEINGRFATVENTPIRFIHQNVEFTDLCALYSIADVCLTTPLRDGMNLVAKEYVACQQNNAGVLVLSEFAGASEELYLALRVNPYNIHEVADAIETGLSMPLKERQLRMKRMRERVLRYDARHWADRFLGDLASRESRETATAEALEGHMKEILGRIAEAKRIAFFLDYDGSLREIVSDPSTATPTAELTALFSRLAAEPRIDTYIISGRKPADLELWLGEYPFTLIGDHGFMVRPRGATAWVVADPHLTFEWKQPVLGLLRHYEANTPGSWVEEKEASLVWHFRNADTEFGLIQARQLVAELSNMTSNLPVVVRRGKMIVEVCSVHIDKGAALKRATHPEGYDFVFVAGDDQTDELMLRLQGPELVRVKVGSGPTAAQYRVASPRMLRRVLGSLLDALPPLPKDGGRGSAHAKLPVNR
ncbi:MAG: bifunctional alpha,alpha-trehalose-phosphate synthase (UDP-forming)/trehalose-phosphatase [Phycisphaerae bacterium]